LKSNDDKNNVLKKGFEDYVLEEQVENDETKFTPPFSKLMVGSREAQIVNKFFLKKYIAYA